MKTKFFNSLIAGLIASGLLSIAPAAFAQATRSQAPADVERLTCVKDAQGLMCKAEEHDSQAVATGAATPAIVNSEQLGRWSDALLACLYFVLPTGLGLAVFLSDKRSELLREQIERLEKLWSQTPQ